MARALWVAVVSPQLAASDRGRIRARALRLSALLSIVSATVLHMSQIRELQEERHGF
jgi:hypothetical protein